MSYIDVLIPAIAGVLLVLAPRTLAKRTGELAPDEGRVRQFRTAGFVLLAVAAGYWTLKAGASR
jgi:hypothetical protein